MVRTGRVLLAALVAGLLTAACGTPKPAATSEPAPSSPAPRAVATSVPPQPTAAAAAAQPPASPAATLTTCQPKELVASAAYRGGAGGSGRVDIILTNRSDRACVTYGYPGLGFLDAHRHNIPEHLARGSEMLTQDHGPRTIVLEPGQSASASLGFSETPAEPQQGGCPLVVYLLITPPNTYSSIQTVVEHPSGPGFSSRPGFDLCRFPTVTALVPGSRGSGLRG